MQKIKTIPKLTDISEDVQKLKAALIARGFKRTLSNPYFGETTLQCVKLFQKSIGLPGSGVIGPKTLAALELELDLPKKGEYPPWYLLAKKFEGKKESDKELQEYMTPYWKKAGLPQYKGLIGSARAWCALAVLMAFSAAGYKYSGLNAAAISGDKFGVEVNWREDGIPRGASVRINHSSNCKSSSGNHIGFADGDCAPADLKVPGAKFNMYGGNQGDSFKVSSFPVNDICSVRWPKEDAAGNPVPPPPKITVSDHCSGAKTPTDESTR